MSTVRSFPQSIIGRQNAMNKAVTKYSNLPVGIVIISAATADRLLFDSSEYNKGITEVLVNKQLYRLAIELAKPQRELLKSFVTSYYTTLNNCIDNLGTIPPSARAFYGLPTNKSKMPSINTDDKLLLQAANVLSGDVLRKAAGGIAMSSPTIAQYTPVYNTASPIIIAISNAKTNLTNATTSLRLKIAEIKDIITKVWDEVEAYYSMISKTERRDQGRLWGIRYTSIGILSVVTGTVKDELGVAVAGVKVRIVGAKISTFSDSLGHFSLNTSLFGDIELEATHLNYEKNIVEFTKEDGVAVVVSVVMIHAI